VSVAKLSNAIRECNTDLAVVFDNGIKCSLMTYGQLYVYSRQVPGTMNCFNFASLLRMIKSKVTLNHIYTRCCYVVGC
jgi:hypothetical protein